MDIQDSSIPKPSPDVCVDVDSNKEINPSEIPTSLAEAVQSAPLPKSRTTNKASQGARRPTRAKTTPVVIEKYRRLFKAAVKGDWKAVKTILNDRPEAMTAKLMTGKGSFTVLDIAVVAEQDQLVENLVKHIHSEYKAPLLPGALYHAARKGRITRVRELVDKLKEIDERNAFNRALSIATTSAPRQKEVIQYLAGQTNSSPNIKTVLNLIKAGHLDILLDLARKNPSLATSIDTNRLMKFALMDSYYRSGAKLNFWEKYIYQCIPRLVDASSKNAKDMKMTRATAIHRLKISLWNLVAKLGKIAYLILCAAPFIRRIGELKLRHECWLELAKLVFKKKKASMGTREMLKLTRDIFLEAASRGISEIVKLCLKHYPELMWDKELTKNLIEEVVRARHVELFRLINGYNTIPNLTYNFQRDCDLMAALVEWSPEYVPADISGSAFLMQRELQWFKVLEDRCSPSIKSLKFKMKMKKEKSDPKSLELELTKERRGKTHWKIFVEQRKDLLKEAGQWMKDTSSSCSLVATLIITVAFAAAFTVPGGDNNGIPIFLKKGSFMVFVVADALALFSSITAVLMFLAILTSRYAAEDFLHSLPRKMILGLTFLFLSLVFMLVAFGSTLTIVLSKRWKWIEIPITLLAAFPVILSIILQLTLYVEMVESTYWPRLYRPMKIWK